jgi:hypothetical protein
MGTLENKEGKIKLVISGVFEDWYGLSQEEKDLYVEEESVLVKNVSENDITWEEAKIRFLVKPRSSNVNIKGLEDYIEEQPENSNNYEQSEQHSGGSGFNSEEQAQTSPSMETTSESATRLRLLHLKQQCHACLRC